MSSEMGVEEGDGAVAPLDIPAEVGRDVEL
jgi:hypothetical protein